MFLGIAVVILTCATQILRLSQWITSSMNLLLLLPQLMVSWFAATCRTHEQMLTNGKWSWSGCSSELTNVPISGVKKVVTTNYSWVKIWKWSNEHSLKVYVWQGILICKGVMHTRVILEVSFNWLDWFMFVSPQSGFQFFQGFLWLPLLALLLTL